MWSCVLSVCGCVLSLYVDVCYLCVLMCIISVCGCVFSLYVVVCSLCMWSCVPSVCGCVFSLYVDVCSLCMWSCVLSVCGRVFSVCGLCSLCMWSCVLSVCGRVCVFSLYVVVCSSVCGCVFSLYVVVCSLCMLMCVISVWYLQVVGMSALACGMISVGTCNSEVTSTILQTLMEKTRRELKDTYARFLALGLGLCYLGMYGSVLGYGSGGGGVVRCVGCVLRILSARISLLQMVWIQLNGMCHIYD